MHLTSPNSLPPVVYRDFPIRLSAAILAAHIFTVFGEPQSSLELMLTKAYYPAVLVSFIIAYALIRYVYWANTLLNRRHDWQAVPLKRTIAQLLLSLLVPSIMAFAMASLYLKLRGVNILRTNYLRYEFPYVLLLLCLLNAYYIIYYFIERLHEAQRMLQQHASMESAVTSEHFLVSNGAKNIPLPLQDIDCIYRSEESNFILAVSGERYYFPGTLDDAMQKVDHRFFRLNRQVIVNRRIIKSFRNDTYGKIVLELTIPIPEEPLVSQKRASAFRDWI